MNPLASADRKPWYRPPLWLVACTLAVAINIPSLWVGWVADDYIHREFILRHLSAPQWTWTSDFWDMFNSHLPVETRVAFGALPWWTSPDLRVALFRPLGTLSHYLDYWLWPESSVAMHAHNLVLFAISVFLVSQLYLRLLPVRVAWIAALLYAADDANTLGVAWIASRNTLLTALFALLTLLEYVHFRADGSKRHAAAAWFALLLAHASSEGALATWAYLVAHAVFVDKAPWRARLLALAPYALLSISFVALTSALGFGVHGSGAYIDPRTQPLLFLEALTTRLPQLVLMQLGVVPELSSAVPEAVAVVLLVLAVLTLLGLVALVARARRDPRDGSGVLFMAFGCLGSLLPICAVGAVGRLLFVSGLGGHALVAALAIFVCDRGTKDWRNKLTPALSAALAACVLLPQGVIDAVGARQAAPWWLRAHRSFLQVARTLPTGAKTADSIVMILNARDYLTTPFVQLYYAAFVMPRPPMIHVLGVSTAAVSVERLDAFNLTLTPEGGYLADPTSILVRPRNLPFKVDQRFDLYGAQVHVEQITFDGRPARIRVATFGLDNPKLLWVAWNDKLQRYEQVVLPSVGQSTLLPALPASARILP